MTLTLTYKHTVNLVAEKGKKRLDKLFDMAKYLDTLLELDIEELDNFFPFLHFISLFLSDYERCIASKEKAQLLVSTIPANNTSVLSRMNQIDLEINGNPEYQLEV